MVISTHVYIQIYTHDAIVNEYHASWKEFKCGVHTNEYHGSWEWKSKWIYPLCLMEGGQIFYPRLYVQASTANEYHVSPNGSQVVLCTRVFIQDSTVNDTEWKSKWLY